MASRLHRIFFYLSLLFLPSQLGRHFWPEWAFVLGRRIDYLSPTLYFTDILIILTLVFWIISLFAVRKGKIDRFPNGYLIIASLLFILTNIFISINRPIAIYSWVKVLEFAAFGWYIVRTKPPVRNITIYLSAAAFYSSVLAIWQFTVGHTIGGLWWYLGERTFSGATGGVAQIPLCLPHATNCPLYLRAYASFPHPNVFGGFLGVTLYLVVYDWLNGSAKHDVPLNRVRLGLAGLFTIALVITFSRSAWIATGAGLVFLYINRRMKRGSRKVMNYLAIFGLVLSFTLVAVPVRVTDESVVVREQLNASAVNIWQSAPLFGTGLGNFLVALPRFLPSRTVYFLQPVHNIYLLILSETGIIGFSLVVLLIAFVLRRIIIVGHDPSVADPGPGNILRAVPLFMILCIGFLDHYPLTLQQGQLLLSVLVSIGLM